MGSISRLRRGIGLGLSLRTGEVGLLSEDVLVN